MEIPNGEILFRYALPTAFPEGQVDIPSSVFQVTELSCDWKAHRDDPATSFHIGHGKTVIISITVCDMIKNPCNPRGVVKESAKQEVIHDPETNPDAIGGLNEAHSLVKGNKKIEAVSALQKNSTWYHHVINN